MKWTDLEWYYCRHQIHSAFRHFVDSSSVFLLLRLEFSRTQHHVTAQVFSSSSPVPVISCSTKEWALKKELASTRCVAACQAVGEVLAQRCQQAGITRIVYRAIPWTYRSDAVSLLQHQWLECIFSLYFFYPLIVFFLIVHRFSPLGKQWKMVELSWVNLEGNISGREFRCLLSSLLSGELSFCSLVLFLLWLNSCLDIKL